MSKTTWDLLCRPRLLDIIKLIECPKPSSSPLVGQYRKLYSLVNQIQPMLIESWDSATHYHSSRVIYNVIYKAGDRWWKTDEKSIVFVSMFDWRSDENNRYLWKIDPWHREMLVAQMLTLRSLICDQIKSFSCFNLC